MDDFKGEFYPLKAKAEKMAELMNNTDMDYIRFTLETKPTIRDGNFKDTKTAYKCIVYKIEEKD